MADGVLHPHPIGIHLDADDLRTRHLDRRSEGERSWTLHPRGVTRIEQGATAQVETSLRTFGDEHLIDGGADPSAWSDVTEDGSPEREVAPRIVVERIGSRHRAPATDETALEGAHGKELEVG